MSPSRREPHDGTRRDEARGPAGARGAHCAAMGTRLIDQLQCVAIGDLRQHDESLVESGKFSASSTLTERLPCRSRSSRVT